MVKSSNLVEINIKDECRILKFLVEEICLRFLRILIPEYD